MVLFPLILKALLALSMAAPLSLNRLFREQDSRRRLQNIAVGQASEWTCIVPYFNEAEVIKRCLSSLASQSCPPKVLLVDNGSTDNGRAVAENFCTDSGVHFTSLTEPVPGKVAALAKGLAATTTPFVATCDADTYYPNDYLARARTLLERPGVVASGAILITDRKAVLRGLWERFHWRAASIAAPWQCHTGGAGQTFRTDVLREVGGFDPAIWNLVLEDHEVIARVGMAGRIAYDSALWCSPLVRQDRHTKVGWSLTERLRYHSTTRRSMPAYFESYLAPRLANRGQWNIKLRPSACQSDRGGQSFAQTISDSLPRSVVQSPSLPAKAA